jgi:glucokinase
MTLPPVVLGLDFGGTKIAAAVCDLAGNKLAATVVESRGELGAEASFAYGIATAHELLRETAGGAALASTAGGAALASTAGGADPPSTAGGADPPSTAGGADSANTADEANTADGPGLVSVGVATFGIPFEDRVELAPAISGWESLAFGRELAAAFPGARISMATDAKAGARAEARWGALAGCDPGIYLNLGTGLAAAIVSGGRVLAGHNGAAGEIGYNLRQPADVGLAAGHRLMLEDMVSGQALARRAAKAGRPLSAAEVFAASESESELDELLTEFVAELAFHVVNLAILVDPQRIAVGGGMARSWRRIQPVLADALAKAVPYPPDLVLADFPYDAPLLGAVALAVDAAQENTAHLPGSQPADDIPLSARSNCAQSNGHSVHKVKCDAP